MKKILSYLLVLFTSTTVSYSQIVYHDISPDTTISTWQVFTVQPIAPGNVKIWWHPGEIVLQTGGNCQVLFSNGYPAKLTLGDTIGPSGTWQTGNYDVLNNGSTGNWQTNATDKYLGFRIQNGSAWRYGWLKMTVTGLTSFTVKEWAYKTANDVSIKAGQVNSVSVNSGASNNEAELITSDNKIFFKNLIEGRKYTLNVVDMSGRIIKSSDFYSNSVLNTDTFPPGVYTLQLFWNRDMYFFKLSLY